MYTKANTVHIKQYVFPINNIYINVSFCQIKSIRIYLKITKERKIAKIKESKHNKKSKYRDDMNDNNVLIHRMQDTLKKRVNIEY